MQRDDGNIECKLMVIILSVKCISNLHANPIPNLEYLKKMVVVSAKCISNLECLKMIVILSAKRIITIHCVQNVYGNHGLCLVFLITYKIRSVQDSSHILSSSIRNLT